MFTNTKAFLGKGWKFPISSGPSGINKSEYEESVKESINIILGTRPGERVMNPEFGCRLWDIVFEPNNHTVYTEIKHIAHESLAKWEPRISVDSVDVESNPNSHERIDIKISYTVNKTNSVHNLVYPFYIGRV